MKEEIGLTTMDAYQAMLVFLDGYYRRTGSDDLAMMLGELALAEDGRSMDPAMLKDWEHAVERVLSHNAKKGEASE